jgi:L(+)-tartrate dehydratase beta subunit
MSDLKTVHLKLPASTGELRKLEIGSVAYLTGRVFTAREGVYKRAIEDGFGMPAAKDALGLVNFHCSPAASINPDGSYSVGAVTATASFRFAKWLDGWFKLSGCNIILGKGGMTAEIYRNSFVPNNAVYLTTVGYGTGALLGRGIRRVAGVYWLEELGLAQAVWVQQPVRARERQDRARLCKAVRRNGARHLAPVRRNRRQDQGSDLSER